MNLSFAAILSTVSVLSLAANTAPRLPYTPVMQPVFESNQGQAPESVLFLARDARGTLEITRTGARVILLKQERGTQPLTAAINLHFPGAHWNNAVGESKLASYSNLLLGNDPSKWSSHIPHFSAVRVPNAYPGIDVVFHARRGVVEFDFELAVGADPRLARFAFPGHSARVLADGSLRIATPAGELSFPKPIAYQANERIVASRFVLTNPHEARFELGN